MRTNVSIPSYREVLPELFGILRRGSLAVLVVDLSVLGQVEQDYGAAAYEEVLDSLRTVMLDLRGEILREGDILTTSDVVGDAFLVFLALKRTNRPVTVSAPEIVAERVENFFNQRLNDLGSPYLRRRATVIVGSGLVLHNPLVMPERLVARLIQSAWEAVQIRRMQRKLEQRRVLHQILLSESIESVYQKIVHLGSGKLLGVEALSRGPSGSKHRSPASLFDLAGQCDLVFELDRLCRQKSVLNAASLPADLRLFVNVLPSCMFDPDFQGSSLEDFLHGASLQPSQLVLEVTERYAIENYEIFGRAVDNLKRLGISIAVDDIGAGHSGLEKIAELRPSYLKFDMNLVRDIDQSFVRREMVRALTNFARKMGSTIIAEGIEREEERHALYDLGIEYGQGYLTGRPEGLELALLPSVLRSTGDAAVI